MCFRLSGTPRQWTAPPRTVVLGVACVLLAVLGLLAEPSPTPAKANVACEIPLGAVGVAGAVTGAIGLGNPVGDVCDKLTGGLGGAITAPVTGALKGLGNDVFEQLTHWVAEGAGWLMGQVVGAIDSSTTPELETGAFLVAYGRMAAIAAVLACAMLLLAILEGIAQGSPGLLVRAVLVNVPLAFLGTSIAFTVVQLLLGVTDGLSAAVSNASHHESTRFFEAAIGDLGHVGGQVGKGAAKATGQSGGEVLTDQAGGAVAVPLFVGFLAAVIGAFAAFFVWLELLMRDAAVYVVVLFMPLTLAAPIWPRWNGVLRRTGELLVALIGSKFVIVAIISLAATLVIEEGASVQQVLVAAALLCLACFSPFVLFRFVAFSDGAFAAAFGRRSAAGGAVGAMQIGTDVQMLRRMGSSDESGSGVSLWGAGEGGGSGGGGGSPAPGRPTAGGPGQGPDGADGAAGAAGASGGGGAAAAEGGPAAAAAVPKAAVHGAEGAAGRLSGTATAQLAGEGGAGEAGGSSPATDQGGSGGGAPAGGQPQESTPAATSPSTPPRPRPEQPEDTGGGSGAGEAGGSPPATGERPPRPTPESPGTRGDKPGGG
jgi:hypothetical protein